jgi:hypothetical protein
MKAYNYRGFAKQLFTSKLAPPTYSACLIMLSHNLYGLRLRFAGSDDVQRVCFIVSRALIPLVKFLVGSGDEAT